MKASDLILVVCPAREEDLTQYIGIQVAEEAGVGYTPADSLPTSEYLLVLELGGIWDRGEFDIAVEDKTNSKIIQQVLSFYFKTMPLEQMSESFKTPLSKSFNSNFVRLELTNKIRYCKESRELLVFVLSKILKKVKNFLKLE